MSREFWRSSPIELVAGRDTEQTWKSAGTARTEEQTWKSAGTATDSRHEGCNNVRDECFGGSWVFPNIADDKRADYTFALQHR
jgi:hypothetical protein